MTTETDTAIETAPRGMWTPDPIHRLTAENVAALRPRCAGRWLARLSSYGPQTWCDHEAILGVPGPAMVHLLDDVGPMLAQTARGSAVNYCLREDGLRAGFRPEDGKRIKGFDLRIAVGVVERAWCDPRGVLGIVLLWDPPAHQDLLRLEQRDALAVAEICTSFTVKQFKITRTPWQLTTVEIFEAHAFGVEFTSLSHDRGARVLRRLGEDEEPDETERLPSETTRVLLPRGAGLSAEAAGVSTLDLAGGAITTPAIAGGAVTNSVAHTGTGGASTTSATEADISGETVTLTISASGSVVLITWNATAALNNNDLVNLVTVAATFKLYRAGAQIYRTDISMPVIQNSGIFVPISMLFQDTGNVGSTTYKIRWSVVGFGGGPVLAGLASGSVLSATELKK